MKKTDFQQFTQILQDSKLARDTVYLIMSKKGEPARSVYLRNYVNVADVGEVFKVGSLTKLFTVIAILFFQI